MVFIDSAALTGTVDFSTTILSVVAVWAICRAASSTNRKSGARPYRSTQSISMSSSVLRARWQIERTYIAETKGFSRCINTDKDQICFLNGFLRVGGEEQISITNLLDDFF